MAEHKNFYVKWVLANFVHRQSGLVDEFLEVEYTRGGKY